MSRKVTIYSPAGKNANQLEIEGRTWKELQSVLSRNSVSYSGMKVVIGENRHTLESENAILPDGDFTLFLMPIKTKSGADRKELMATIKDFVTKNPTRKHDFIIDDKNMTQLSTSVLEQLVAKYIGGKTVAPVDAPVTDHITESAKKAVESVKSAKVTEISEIDYPSLIAAKKTEIDVAVKAGNYAVLAGISAEITKLEKEEKEYINKLAEQKAAKEKVEKEAKEAEEKARKESEKGSKDKLVVDLDKQARELARDFKDLKSF
jgi:hypothetical protein